MMISALRLCKKPAIRTTVVVRSLSTLPKKSEDPYWPLISNPKRFWAEHGRSMYEESSESKMKRLSVELWANKNRLAHLQEWVKQGRTTEPARAPLAAEFAEKGRIELPKTYYPFFDGSRTPSLSFEEEIKLKSKKVMELESEIKSLM